MSKHYIIPIFVPHEGCPHDCVFCNQGKITGEEKGIILGPKNKIENSVNRNFVINTVEEYLETIDRGNSTLEISFFGGTFTAVDINKQKELLQVAKEYKEKGIIDYIRLSTRPDYINEYILNHLKEYMVDIIELGVQSLDEEVLRKSGRGHSATQVYVASKLINDYGFTLGHQIMIGLPGDNFEKDIYTAIKSIEMSPKICRIYPALVIKDTPMEEMYLNNTYRPYTLEEALNISEKLYRMYKENNINIIRVGLQPTDNIAEGKDIVAGPFHPAFRELVESKIINDNIFTIIKDIEGEVVIKIHPNRISKLYAGKKRYFYQLKEKIVNSSIVVDITKLVDLNSIVIEAKSGIFKVQI